MYCDSGFLVSLLVFAVFFETVFTCSVILLLHSEANCGHVF